MVVGASVDEVDEIRLFGLKSLFKHTSGQTLVQAETELSQQTNARPVRRSFHGEVLCESGIVAQEAASHEDGGCIISDISARVVSQEVVVGPPVGEVDGTRALGLKS